MRIQEIFEKARKGCSSGINPIVIEHGKVGDILYEVTKVNKYMDSTPYYNVTFIDEKLNILHDENRYYFSSYEEAKRYIQSLNKKDKICQMK